MADKMEHEFTFKGKPSVKNNVQPSKEDLAFIESIEKKYEKNTAIKSEDITKYFEITKTQIRSKLLKDVLSIGNVWVKKRDGVYGQGVQNIKETPKDPNRRKKSVQEAFKKAIESAMETTKQLREESVSISEAKQEVAQEENLAKELVDISSKNQELADTNAKATEDLVSKSQNVADILNNAQQADISKPKKKRATPKNKSTKEPIQETKPNVQETEQTNQNTNTEKLPTDIGSAKVKFSSDYLYKDVRTVDQWLEKKFEQDKTTNAEYRENPDTQAVRLKSLDSLLRIMQNPSYKTDTDNMMAGFLPEIETEASHKDILDYIKNKTISLIKQESLKQVRNLPLFEDAISKKDPIEEAQRKEQERQAKIKAQEEAARKAIEEAINPITDSIEELLGDQASTGTPSSGGGSSKPPKTPKGFDNGGDDGDDDDDSNYYDSDEEYNPKRYLKAQIENLQRSFNAKLFGEKESTLFSSLQKAFDRGSRTEDLDELEKVIDQETRLQSKILKDFETSNQNTANLLEAKTKEMLIREQGKDEESQDPRLIKWLETRLQEIKDVREATTKQYEDIQKSIESEIRQSATRGFASGTIERDIKKLEQDAKDEEKILAKYNKEFSKYVSNEYDRLAKEQAFEATKSYIDQNKGKMSSEELTKKARKLFDREYATYIQNTPQEPELTSEQIVSAYEQGEGSFSKDAFKVKNAPKGFGEKSKYDPTQEDYITPDKRSIPELVEDPAAKSRLKNNLMVWGAIKGTLGPVASASASSNASGQGTVSGVASNASAGAFALSAIGKAGPYGTLIAASLQTVSILGEIADNTAKNVEAFSPEVLMAGVENKLLRLNQNIAIGNEKGTKLAEYQRSQGTLSRQMYELGVEFFSILQPFIVIVVEFINIMLAFINLIATMGSTVIGIFDPVLTPFMKFLRDSSEGWQIVINFLKGRKDNSVPNYTEEFMKNDPRQNITHV